jgi:hypothetical protein
MLPITIPPDGGIEITVTLDSTYADYQRKDDDALRGISWRVRRAISPAAFVPMHEIDMEAENLRDAIRYSYSLLSRGLIIPGGCIYINGQPRTEVVLTDVDPKDVAALEVYVPGTLEDRDRLPPFPRNTPCEGLWASVPPPFSRQNTRVPVQKRGNRLIAIVIWTRGRGD